MPSTRRVATSSKRGASRSPRPRVANPDMAFKKKKPGATLEHRPGRHEVAASAGANEEPEGFEPSVVLLGKEGEVLGLVLVVPRSGRRGVRGLDLLPLLLLTAQQQ